VQRGWVTATASGPDQTFALFQAKRGHQGEAASGADEVSAAFAFYSSSG
jgi:hypothetical protein